MSRLPHLWFVLALWTLAPEASWPEAPFELVPRDSRSKGDRTSDDGSRLLLLGTRLLDGKVRDVAAQEDWQLILFWSVDCTPCVETLRELGPALREARSRGIEVTTVAIGERAGRPAARRWIERLGLPVERSFVVPRDRLAGRIDPRFGIELDRLPKIFLIGPDQEIRWSREGEIRPADVTGAVESAVAGPDRITPQRSADNLGAADILLDRVVIDGFFGTLNGGTVDLAAQLESTCATYAAGGNVRGESVCASVLGMLWLKRGNVEAARQRLEQAQSGFDRLDDPFGRWMVLLSAAQLAKVTSDPRAARGHFDRALAEVEDMRAHPEQISMESFRLFAAGLGVPEPLLRMVELNAPLLKSLFANPAEAMTRMGFAVVLRTLGDIEAARSELERALVASQGFFGLVDGPVLFELGKLERRAGNLERSRTHLEAALAKQPQGLALVPGTPRVSILAELRDVEAAAGRIEQALALSRRARQEARELADIGWQVRLLLREGQLLVSMDRFDDAQASMAAAEALVGRSDDPCLRAEVGFAKSLRAVMTSRFEASQRTITESLVAMGECRNPYLHSQLLVVGAAACLLRGDEDCRQELQAEAVRIAQEADFSEGVDFARLLDVVDEVKNERKGEGFAAAERLLRLADARNVEGMMELLGAIEAIVEDKAVSQGELPAPAGPAADPLPGLRPGQSLLAPARTAARALREVKAGLLDRAVASLRAAADGFHAGGLTDLEAMNRAAAGMVLHRLGRSKEASEDLVRAADGFESLIEHFAVDDYLATFMGSDRQRVYTVLVEVLLAAGRHEQAFHYSELARSRALLLQLGSRADAAATSEIQAQSVGDGRLRTEIDHLRATIAKREAELDSVATATGRQEIEGQLVEARAALDDMIATEKLFMTSPTMPIDAVELAELRSQILPPDTSLVSFFFIDRGVVAWVIDREGVAVEKIPWSQKDDDRVICMASRVARSVVRGSDPEAGCGDADSSSRALYAKLVAPLEAHLRHNNVVLVPHGVLHHLPFAALRDPEGRFWIEEITLSYAPSASVLEHLPSGAAIGHRALVFGASQDSHDPLPWAEIEAVAVAKRLGAEPVLGPAAYEAVVWDRASKIDVLHLAAHGFFDPNDPRSGHIALVPGGRHDGRLEVRELLDDLRFESLDLVVLSACQTALGDRTRGDDIVGLVRAFMAAGAPSVIATLWLVDDQASADLMVSFYDHLRAGMPVAQALRQAQLDRIHGHEDDDPYDWAAFGLYGSAASVWRGLEDGHTGMDDHKQ